MLWALNLNSGNIAVVLDFFEANAVSSRRYSRQQNQLMSHGIYDVAYSSENQRIQNRAAASQY